MSSINHSKDFDLKTMESNPETVFKLQNTSYQDQVKICRKNNLSQLSKLGNNFATEDHRQHMEAELAKKQTSPLDIYGESATFDEFCKSISGKFNTNMIKGNKNKRILIPKNSIKTPSKSTANKAKKGKKRKGAESCRIEKYLKRAEKFSYPGSSLSILNQDSTQFATIDSNKIKVFKKNKIINASNLNKKIKNRKEIQSIKSGEYNMDGEINLTNVKNFEKMKIKSLMKSKRKSLTSEASLGQVPKPPAEKVYKVKHNNSKKRSSSKSKSKGPKPKFPLSSYAEKLKKSSKLSQEKKGLSTRESGHKLSHIFDVNLAQKKAHSKEKSKKGSLEKKYFKKLNFKKKSKVKNSTFDFTNFNA